MRIARALTIKDTSPRSVAAGTLFPGHRSRSPSRTVTSVSKLRDPTARVTTAVPKQAIPSPNMVHYRGGPAMIDPAVYPDPGEFWTDLAAVYADN
jgi:hypothetical protein